ncbi:hypothetical protein M427DRAFT_490014 [Gonapodya prolifera JEL478]|uniref:CUB domain-containing protein n=1 Tax=Gonapodya prolifera (strain JEL478) TaxID=1344416 RepID=A0A138ZZ24_GONPJ|nr:hypothetical protein M427DRAFT_490014 [Gonapodya prolifera JEL478]|eukprot:KXS09525.1 hypothetical protein M427DRAFT_490014 [Gonapodya prolifera JEL478]
MRPLFYPLLALHALAALCRVSAEAVGLPPSPSASWTYCSGSTALTLSSNPFAFGTDDAPILADGSPARTYANDMRCVWRINAGFQKRVRVSFSLFNTECGWDFLNVYDGASVDANSLLAQLCGKRAPGESIVSSSSSLTLIFTSDSSVAAAGFRATAVSIDPCDASCSSRGVCLANSSCSCNAQSTGPVCDRTFSGDLLAPLGGLSLPFTPSPGRAFHSAALDPTTSKLYLTGGTRTPLIPYLDMLVLDFPTSTWTSLKPPVQSPARSGHASFVHNGSLYVYAGRYQTDIVALNLSDPAANWTRVVSSSASVGAEPPAMDGFGWVFATLPAPPLNPAASPSLPTPALFIHGGLWTDMTGRSLASRSLFMFNLTSRTWMRLLDSLTATYGSAGVYHEGTNSVLFFGGYRFGRRSSVLQYLVGAQKWVENGGAVPSQYVRSFSTATTIAPDLVLLYGGQTINDATISPPSGDCFHSMGAYSLYDAACGVFLNTSVAWDATYGSLRRMGHTATIRNGSLWIAGGTDGIPSADTFSVPIDALLASAQTSPPTAAALDSERRDHCRAASWCAGAATCDECATYAGCTWCGEGGGGCQRDPARCTVAPSGPAACPVVQEISPWARTLVTLVPLASTDFKAQINSGPEVDLYFQVDIATGPTDAVGMRLLNVMDPPLSSASGFPVLLTGADTRRFTGMYYIRLSNRAAQNVTFLFWADTKATTAGGKPGMAPDPFDMASFLGALASTLLTSLLITSLIRRIRTNQINRDRANPLTLIPLESIPIPKMYHVTLPDRPYGSEGLRQRRSQAAGGSDGPSAPSAIRNEANLEGFEAAHVVSAAKDDKTNEESVNEQGERQHRGQAYEPHGTAEPISSLEDSNILKSAFASTEPHGEFHVDPFRSPISLEHMERPDGPAVLAASYILLFPGAQEYIDHDLLPPVAIGTTAFEQEVVDPGVKKPRDRPTVNSASCSVKSDDRLHHPTESSQWI